jgi:hypothetical protein
MINTPWKTIVDEIFTKHQSFDYVINVNNSKWYSNSFYCPIKETKYPTYIGINGWNIITGIGNNIQNKFDDLDSIAGEIKADSSSSIICPNIVMILLSLTLLQEYHIS